MMHEFPAWPQLTLVACGIISALSFSYSTYAEDELLFDNSFLRVAHPENIDLSAYSTDSVPAGRYRADIYLNDGFLLTDEVQVGAPQAGKQPILLSRTSIAGLQLKDDAACGGAEASWCDVQTAVPNSRIRFDSSKQRIDISIPQAQLHHISRDEIQPAARDAGIPALLLGYNINGYRSENSGGTYNSLYSSLNAGMNIGSWYFRPMDP